MQAASSWWGAQDPYTGEVGIYHYFGESTLFPPGWKRSWVNNQDSKPVYSPYWPGVETNDYGNYL